MQKVIRHSRRFVKRYKKLPASVKKVFKEKVVMFLEDHRDVRLGTHKLHGRDKDKLAFEVTGDIRVVFTLHKEKDRMLITFTFLDIGTHNQVY